MADGNNKQSTTFRNYVLDAAETAEKTGQPQDLLNPGKELEGIKYKPEPGMSMAIDNEGKPVRVRVEKTMAGESFKKLVGGQWVPIPKSEFNQLTINTHSVANAAGIPLSQMPDLIRNKGDKVQQFMKGEISSLREKPKQVDEGASFVTKKEKEPEVPAQYQPKGQRTYNPATERLQAQLQSLGYDLGPDGVDGYFGDDTAKALIEFKKKRGLPPNKEVNDTVYTHLLIAGRSSK